MRELIVLEGSAEQVGRTLGILWAADLTRDTAEFFTHMQGEGLEADFLIREGREFEKRLRDVAPHMLVEVTSTAQAADVPVERFVAYMGLKYLYPERLFKAPEWAEPVLHGCTSFMATGAASGVGANLLHKNRDARQVPQSAHVKQIEGKRRVLGSGDVGDLGLCHALNADGLAGKTNSGNRVEKPLRRSLSTTEVLRHIVEECATCEQALDRMKHLARAGLIANGTGGCIWLFADRERGLIIEEVPFKIDWEFIEDDVAARGNEFKLPRMRADSSDAPRYATALRKMRALAGDLRPEHLNRLARDIENPPTPICNTNTTSTTTSVIPFDPASPPYWEITLGHPHYTFYLPVSPIAKGVPRPLADGSLWRLANRLRERNPYGPHAGLDLEAREQRFRARHAAAEDLEAMSGALAMTAREIERALADAADGGERATQSDER